MHLREKILNWVNSYIHLPVVGFDISDLSVKYVKLGGRRVAGLEDWGEFEIPEGVIEAGEIKNIEVLKSLLASWAKRDGRKLASSFFAVSLPEEKGFLRLIQIPKVKKEDVANAIRWEIEGNIPLGLEELYYDFEVVEREDGGDHSDVVITAFPRAVVDLYVEAFRRTGMRLAALEPEPQAIIRVASADIKDSKTRIIADMGRTKTGIAIFAGGALIFTSAARIGGKTIEENMAKDLGVEANRARSIKEETGLDPYADEGRVFSALSSSLSPLTDELKRTVDYYRDFVKHRHGISPEIEEVLLSGGDANIAGLDTYFSSALKIPVRRLYPALAAPRREEKVPEITRGEMFKFTVALGLALRGIK